MSLVFIDTAGWIALLNKRDGLHVAARSTMSGLLDEGARLVSTEFVLIEVADALCSRGLRFVTISFINEARQRRDLRIIPLSDELLQAGWNLYAQRTDKEWGLTDCTSFAAMTQENIARAFTSDHHFAQAGFATLL